MKLLEVVKIIEQEMGQQQQQVAQAPQAQTIQAAPQAAEKVIEFPAQNFSVSLFSPEKKLLLSPTRKSASASPIRSLINQIKQQGFQVVKTTPKNGDSFEVEFDKRVDFGKVVEFIRSQAVHQ